MSRFDGKVALVTGAGKGIGAATAKAFAAEGAAVVVVDMDSDAAEAVSKEIATVDGAALALSGDVRDEATAEHLVQQAVLSFGGLDVLFNNAGIIRYGEVPDFATADWEAVIGTNLTAPFLMAKYAIPAMRARRGGAVVNTASVQAFATQRTVAAYAASKGGVVALTKTMALDHAPDHIRVNCIAPGSVRTPMLEEAARSFYPNDPEQGLREFGQAHPIGFLTEPEDVAQLVLFLASDAARTITGACYEIDGGLLAKLGV